jgi:hypothetical protein
MAAAVRLVRRGGELDLPRGGPLYWVVVSDGVRSVPGEGASAEEAWWQACGRALGVPRSGPEWWERVP